MFCSTHSGGSMVAYFTQNPKALASQKLPFMSFEERSQKIVVLWCSMKITQAPSDLQGPTEAD